MSGPGDVGGEVSGEEAAWRDLIAHYDTADEVDQDAVPWPDRESLTDPGAPGRDAEAGSQEPGESAPGSPAAKPSGNGRPAPGQPGSRPTGTGPSGLGPAATGQGPAQHAFDYSPVDRTRLIRPAGDPRNYSPPDDADEQPFIPPPLPPPAKLDPIAKAAWAGLIGGPVYLLIGVLIGWTISGIAAFIAIAVFIAGFVILVLRLGDHSKRDDDDDGAVV